MKDTRDDETEKRKGLVERLPVSMKLNIEACTRLWLGPESTRLHHEHGLHHLFRFYGATQATRKADFVS
jgi:hypothetical protein